ncbi:cation:proton antiporter [Chitinimonas koreensis]|uniref:cation:proton antiporter n=1 Tax=Chitinimonas koreensis TaxID=356302 RepID=UPI000411F93F|nr:cation:proton antiporter [Chitinimonas koreensis]QNM94798.1 cation:proton antiporter [Chitinimonas koreensis]
MDYTLFARSIMQDNHLIMIGLCLLGAVLLAEAGHRLLRLPTITGYLITGLVFGPVGLRAIDPDVMRQLALFSDIAIGILLFELGRHLDWHWLRREPRLLALALIESVAVFAAVYALFSLLGIEPVAAGLLAILAMTTSPVILLPILRETRAEGRVSEWARLFAAVNNALALVLAVLLISLARFAREDGWRVALLDPAWELVGAVGLGVACAFLLCLFLRWLRQRGQRDVLPMLFLFGAIVAAVGIAQALGVPPLLAVLSLGIATRNIGRGEALLGLNIDHLRSLFVCVLFVQIGASLDLTAWLQAPLWAALYLAVRGAVRIAVPWLLAPFSGISHAQGGWLGVVLLPMSSLAVLTMHGTVAAIPELSAQTTAIALAALCLLEAIGPITTRWALRRAGETAAEQGAKA